MRAKVSDFFTINSSKRIELGQFTNLPRFERFVATASFPPCCSPRTDWMCSSWIARIIQELERLRVHLQELETLILQPKRHDSSEE